MRSQCSYVAPCCRTGRGVGDIWPRGRTGHAARDAALFPELSRNDAITIARWANGDRTLTLSRSVFSVVFQLVMMSTTLNDLAEASVAEAVISPDEADEALQREADRRKKELAEAIADQDRARLRNKGAFHP